MSYAAIHRGAVGLGTQSEDMEAINSYIMTTPVKTDKALQLKDEWLAWYDNLSWYERKLDSAIYDDARNKRNAFNAANAVTQSDVDAARNVLKTGLTTEETEGGTRRMSSEGKFPGSGEPPLVSNTTKALIAVGLLGSAYVYFGWIRPSMKLFRGAYG